jgi:hypothetical protein
VSEPVRLCGLGARVPEETTLEALIALGDCRQVFCRVEDPRFSRWLTAQGISWKRPKSAAEVVAAARKNGGPVGLATWGHPQFNSRFAREVELGLKAAGLPYRVYGAVSTVGAVFSRSTTFLGGDYGVNGIQCYELESFLSDSASAASRFPLIVFSEKSRAVRWSAFFDRLKTLYPAAHEARVYHHGDDAEISLPVGKLTAKGFSGATVMMPAIKTPLEDETRD